MSGMVDDLALALDRAVDALLAATRDTERLRQGILMLMERLADDHATLDDPTAEYVRELANWWMVQLQGIGALGVDDGAKETL